MSAYRERHPFFIDLILKHRLLPVALVYFFFAALFLWVGGSMRYNEYLYDLYTMRTLGEVTKGWDEDEKGHSLRNVDLFKRYIAYRFETLEEKRVYGTQLIVPRRFINLKRGDTIPIEYQFINPTESRIRGLNLQIVSYVLLGIGGVFFLIASGFLYRVHFDASIRHALDMHGKHAHGKVVAIKNSFFKRRGKRLKIMHYEFVDPFKKKHHGKTGPLWPTQLHRKEMGLDIPIGVGDELDILYDIEHTGHSMWANEFIRKPKKQPDPTKSNKRK